MHLGPINLNNPTVIKEIVPQNEIKHTQKCLEDKNCYYNKMTENTESRKAGLKQLFELFKGKIVLQ